MSDGIRVLVCGGRDYTNVPFIWSTLDALDQRARILVGRGTADMVRRAKAAGIETLEPST